MKSAGPHRRGGAARSFLAAVEIVAGGLVAHTAAGGELPSVGWLLLLAASAYAASMLVFSRRISPGLMALAFGGGQVAIHTFVSATAPAVHVHGAHEASPDPVWMVLAHAASAVIAAVVWRTREEALRVILTRPTVLLGHLLLRPPVLPPGAVVLRARQATHVLRRGPPVELQLG